MADIIIHDAGQGEHEHCPECERRFAEIEQRLLAIEAHHPIMDQNTADALAVAEEAVAMAEEAQEEAEEAKLEAEVAAAAAVVSSLENTGEEELSNAETIVDETGSDTEAGISGEEESGEGEEPVVIEPESEPKPEPARRTTYRFARGRKR